MKVQEEGKTKETPQQYKSILVQSISHTETVEFTKYSFDGKFLVTGGMNNQVKVWSSEKNYEQKCVFDGPTDDINFIDWHPKGNVVICGGKDYMIWMFNGQSGEYLSSFAGHEDEVLSAKFTPLDGGKQIVSSSADKTIRLWSPMKNNCLQTLRNPAAIANESKFHITDISTIALHHERPMVMSGDLGGKVFVSHYQTGEIGGMIGSHKDSVECLCLSTQLPMGASCGIDTAINIYDLTKVELRNRIAPAEYGGYSKIQFS
eukprot:CAMPEP_0170543388 /NCGR_PEP_ID=MMETSP0211-20121228/2511_1 /TAXON_ID=311385 /ORGANISM="Pseudokeronopsis sp., Strain OXSARD2" /LENGTH=260 /DNA_ID=CAMNT_0010846731 /DNA_START=386 /DNA_END=1168 /DNA_ORIENTATION=-